MKEIKIIKICFLITGFADGGAQKQCIYLLNKLQTYSTIELHLIHFFKGVNYELLSLKNIETWSLNTGSFYNPRNIIKIQKIIRKIQPDILFSWLHASDVYSFFLRHSVPKLKWIMAERDSSYPFDLRFILRRFLALFADMIICNSQNGRLYWLSKNAAAHKIHVIPNMVVPQRGHLSDSIKGKPIVVYAGRLEAQKNVIVLAKAYCQLSTAYPDGRFFMIGDGSLRQEIEDIFMKAGIHENVSVLPFQKHIIHYFSAADVFVNVSLHEGLPNTVLENILLENKIVVSDIPEHRDIMGPEHPFYINDFTDFDKVTLGIKKAIESTENMDYMHFARNRLKLMQPQIIADSYYELFVQLGG